MERHAVRSVLPELGYRARRIIQRNTSRDQVGPDRECLEVASSVLAVAERSELTGLRPGLENRGGGGQLIFVDAAEDRLSESQLTELLSGRLADSLAIRLARQTEADRGVQRLHRQAEHRCRVDHGL